MQAVLLQAPQLYYWPGRQPWTAEPFAAPLIMATYLGNGLILRKPCPVAAPSAQTGHEEVHVGASLLHALPAYIVSITESSEESWGKEERRGAGQRQGSWPETHVPADCCDAETPSL